MSILTAIIPIILASAALQPSNAVNNAASNSENSPASTEPTEQTEWTPDTLLRALAENETNTETLRGQVRYTVIKAIESDLQQRTGDLFIRRVEDDSTQGLDREYAIVFNRFILDNRALDVREHYIFDGRWFIERLYDERQFNKREIVPMGETLDPMALMSEAPYWVSLGSNADELRRNYTLSVEDQTSFLSDNEDIPELAYLAPLIEDHVTLTMIPKPGSEHEDDWESVRLWFHPETLQPRLSIKTEWSGDTQIVELHSVQTGTPLSDAIFDTQTPTPESGWRVNTTPWRGDASHAGTP